MERPKQSHIIAYGIPSLEINTKPSHAKPRAVDQEFINNL